MKKVSQHVCLLRQLHSSKDIFNEGIVDFSEAVGYSFGTALTLMWLKYRLQHHIITMVFFLSNAQQFSAQTPLQIPRSRLCFRVHVRGGFVSEVLEFSPPDIPRSSPALQKDPLRSACVLPRYSLSSLAQCHPFDWRLWKKGWHL